MGGHGHEEPYKIPDYRIFKVENCPDLIKVQKALAQKGLKDPWLRNEAWRYGPEFSTFGKRTRAFFLRGFRLGFAAFLATIAGEALYKKFGPSEQGHGHH